MSMHVIWHVIYHVIIDDAYVIGSARVALSLRLLVEESLSHRSTKFNCVGQNNRSSIWL